HSLSVPVCRRPCALSLPTTPPPPPPPRLPYTTLFRSQLVAAQAGVHAGGGHRPVRVSLEQGAVFAHHLRLHPKAEGKALSRQFRSEEHTSELQSRFDIVCRLLLEKDN